MADALYRVVRALFDAVPAGQDYRLLGVGLSDLVPENEADLTA